MEQAFVRVVVAEAMENELKRVKQRKRVFWMLLRATRRMRK